MGLDGADFFIWIGVEFMPKYGLEVDFMKFGDRTYFLPTTFVFERNYLISLR